MTTKERVHRNNFEMAIDNVHRSPMNPRCWLVRLTCNHEVWIGGTKPRKGQKFYCNRCREHERGAS